MKWIKPAEDMDQWLAFVNTDPGHSSRPVSELCLFLVVPEIGSIV